MNQSIKDTILESLKQHALRRDNKDAIFIIQETLYLVLSELKKTDTPLVRRIYEIAEENGVNLNRKRDD